MRRVFWLAAKIAITTALLYSAVGQADFGMLAERLSSIDPGWIGAAIAALVVQTFLMAVRWRLIARQLGAPLSLASGFKFGLIGTFFNQVLPSSVGGDAARIWLLTGSGAGWSIATYSVLLDRFIGLLALAVMVVACLPWSFELIQNPVGRNALLVIGFGSIAASVGFLSLGYIPRIWSRDWWAVRHVRALAVTARELLLSPTKGGALMGLSLLVHVLSAAAAWFAARAVGAPFDFGQAILLLPPIILIMTIPISISGWGVRESALMLAFTYAGLARSDGLIVSLLFGAVGLAVGLIGGALWLVSDRSMVLPPFRTKIAVDRIE